MRLLLRRARESMADGQAWSGSLSSEQRGPSAAERAALVLDDQQLVVISVEELRK